MGVQELHLGFLNSGKKFDELSFNQIVSGNKKRFPNLWTIDDENEEKMIIVKVNELMDTGGNILAVLDAIEAEYEAGRTILNLSKDFSARFKVVLDASS